jgi:hypothetical protein
MKKYDTKKYLENSAARLGLTVSELIKRRVAASLLKKAEELGITPEELQLQRVKDSQERKRLDALWYDTVDTVNSAPEEGL